MAVRFFLGLIEGLVIGAGFAVASVRVLGTATPSAGLAALLAAGAGFLVGLIAGRPIWAKDAKVEALLKAIAGAIAAAALSFGLGRWLSAAVDLRQFALGIGPVGKLSAVSLPAIATALALFFELDDGGSPSASPRTGTARRQRVEPDSSEELAELDEADTDEKRRFEKR